MILPAKFKYSKKIFRPSAETKNDKGGPLPRNGRFAAEGRFIQCKFGKTDREGGTCSQGGLDLASRGGYL